MQITSQELRQLKAQAEQLTGIKADNFDLKPLYDIQGFSPAALAAAGAKVTFYDDKQDDVALRSPIIPTGDLANSQVHVVVGVELNLHAAPALPDADLEEHTLRCKRMHLELTCGTDTLYNERAGFAYGGDAAVDTSGDAAQARGRYYPISPYVAAQNDSYKAVLKNGDSAVTWTSIITTTQAECIVWALVSGHRKDS